MERIALDTVRECIMKIYTILKNIARKVSLDYVHPIGEIFISCDADFNPNTTWGGVWQKLTDKFLVGAGNDYALGDVGGEATHTLTVDEMPNHYHRVTWGTGSSSQLMGMNASGNAHIRLTYTSAVASENIFADYMGGGNSHNNLPPYQAVFMWQRTA